MMSQTTLYALTMLASGISIPVLAALNATLGKTLGSPIAASAVLFSVSFLLVAILTVVSGQVGHLANLSAAPKYLLVAGGLVAFYILSVTFIAPHFGVGNTIFFVLLGQMISAALIDHYGLFGAGVSPLSLTRAAGIALMAAGVWLTQQA